MMTNEELKKYKDEVEKEFGKSQILKAKNDHTKKNCGNTGDREAPYGASWIDYWRAMTGTTATTLSCSSCGKEIIVGEPSLSQIKEFTKGDDSVEKHKAQGGHVHVEAPTGADYVGGRYIAPLCPKCNGQHDEHITIKKGSVYCKEVGAKKNDK